MPNTSKGADACWIKWRNPAHNSLTPQKLQVLWLWSVSFFFLFFFHPPPIQFLQTHGIHLPVFTPLNHVPPSTSSPLSPRTCHADESYYEDTEDGEMSIQSQPMMLPNAHRPKGRSSRGASRGLFEYIQLGIQASQANALGNFSRELPPSCKEIPSFNNVLELRAHCLLQHAHTTPQWGTNARAPVNS